MVGLGMRTSKALAMAEIPRSTYYYRSNGRHKGKKPSTHTLRNGRYVTNEQLVNDIKDILGQDFIDYGYARTTKAIVARGYHVNRKKVYKLMKANNLLLQKRKAAARKNYVKDFVPLCTAPFQVIEADIKYVFVQGLRKNAYLITFLDVFSRAALVWGLEFNMKASRVVGLVNQFLENWLIPWNVDPNQAKVAIRTDNGPQFIAAALRDHLNSVGIENEYIEPATPQQNGHIESFHATVTKLVCNKYYFDHLDQAREVFERFFHTYNNIRIMESIGYKTPMQFLRLWKDGHIDAVKQNKKVIYFFREETTSLKPVASSSEYLWGNDKFTLSNNRYETYV